MRYWLPLRSLAVVLSMLLALACTNELQIGDNDGESHAIADEALPATVFIDSYCQAVWNCASTSDIVAGVSEGLGGRFTSVEDCKENAGPEFGVSFENPEIEAAVEAGRLEIDRSHRDACIAEWEQALCERRDFFDAKLPPACRALFAGQQQEDQHCYEDLECSGELVCQRSAVTDACYGICAAPGPEGEVCDTDYCDDDHFCDYDTEPLSCAARIAENSPCAWTEQCRAGLVCEDEICVPFQLRSQGQDCEYGSDYCEPGTRCHVEAPADLSPDFEWTGSCEPIGIAGDTCLNERDCLVGLRCQFTDEEDFHGTCTARSNIGGDCQRTSDCLEGYCGEQGCTPYLSAGASCEASFQCESRSCVASGENSICQARPEICVVPPG